ncbi:MAG TPA: BBP7 family outer membrane beta-barrel protein [Pirellulaceae bacterium]|nr:BBP7 family outer membrane beta-barrel protein [Pirellulaceae bacterium]
MKLQTMLLVIAAAWLAAVPSRGLSQDFGPYAPQPAGWYDASLQEGANPALLNPAEDLCCDDGCCGSCSRCCKNHSLWGSAEFLMWWGKGSHLPPLVTTNPQGTLQADAGRLDNPTTTVLFGNELVGEELQYGARLTFGLWLDPEHNVSAGGRVYGLGGDQEGFFANSAGDPILARPFFNALLGQQDALLVAFPGVVQGSITANYETDNFIGSEAFMTIMMERDCRRRVDLLLGYHFLRMDDSLTINSTSTVTEVGGNLPQGTTFNLTDIFRTQNEFHGGEIGFKGRMANGCWSLDGLAKVSLGAQRQQVAINGFGDVTIPPGGPVPLNGGFLALPTNIGTFERTRFVIIPEATLNLTYHFSPCLSAHVGYNIIWLSEAVTSGDQIDLALNLSQQAGPLVGPARPAVLFHERDYWVQGINLGVNWDF